MRPEVPSGEGKRQGAGLLTQPGLFEKAATRSVEHRKNLRFAQPQVNSKPHAPQLPYNGCHECSSRLKYSRRRIGTERDCQVVHPSGAGNGTRASIVNARLSGAPSYLKALFNVMERLREQELKVDVSKRSAGPSARGGPVEMSRGTGAEPRVPHRGHQNPLDHGVNIGSTKHPGPNSVSQKLEPVLRSRENTIG